MDQLIGVEIWQNGNKKKTRPEQKRNVAAGRWGASEKTFNKENLITMMTSKNSTFSS